MLPLDKQSPEADSTPSCNEESSSLSISLPSGAADDKEAGDTDEDVVDEAAEEENRSKLARVREGILRILSTDEEGAEEKRVNALTYFHI